MTNIDRTIVVSVVSHGHGPLLRDLMQDLARHCAHHALHVEITLNTDEAFTIEPELYPFQISVHRNIHPKGFGANHNAAFHRVQCAYFCVLNPDVRLTADPFGILVSHLMNGAGLVAPQVVSTTGELQPTARHLPTPQQIVQRLLGAGPVSYNMTSGIVRPDWVGGMFMLFSRDSYEAVNGFDEHFFLYYEDVDICVRLRLHGYTILVDPRVTVVHDGAYASRRSWKHFRYHIASMARFFASDTYTRIQRQQ